MKIETYEVPTMQATNYNRPGGLMEVMYCEDGKTVLVAQKMPSAISPNLPWPTIASASMSLEVFNAVIKPSIDAGFAKLVKSEVS